MPGNHPEVRIQHSDNSRSLKSRIFGLLIQDILMLLCMLWQCVVCQGGANLLLKIFLLATLHSATAQNIHSNPICPGFMGFKELCASVPQNLFWDIKCPWVLPGCKNTTFLNI